MNYTQVTQEKVEVIHTTMSQVQASYYGMLATKQSDVLIARPQHIKVKIESETLIYKVFDVKNKKTWLHRDAKN